MKNKLINFGILLIISALVAAGISAFFSIIGISTLFSGALISAAIMAGSLELSKIMSVTFLYRYWKKCKLYLKTCLVIFTFIIMLITSAGIFGFLSSAYQTTSIEYGIIQEKIKTTQDQKGFYQDKIVISKQRIENLTKLRFSQNTNQMSEFVVRSPLLFKQMNQQISDTDIDIKDENIKIQNTIDEIQKIDDKINQLKIGAGSHKDIQTFKFVADAFGVSLDVVAKWFIIVIVTIFDPISICLILAYNIAVYRKEDESVYDTPSIEANLPSPTPIWSPKNKLIEPEPIPSVIVEPPKKDIVEPKIETSPQVQSSLTDWFKQMFKI